MKKMIIVAFLVSLLASTCYAESGFFGASPEGTPSIINYGREGLILGALLGASAGYLQYTHDKETSHVGKDAAYGALIGTAGGLVLGFSDAAKGKKGYGAIGLRDMRLSGNLGFVVGAIVGGIQYSSNKEWTRVTKGMAWGYLGGAVAGLAIAFYEGPILVDYSKNKLIYNVAFLSDSQDRICPGYGVSYRF